MSVSVLRSSITAKVQANLPAGFDAFIGRLMDAYKPKEIILFGSRADGTAGPDSDTDLLVVIDHEGRNQQLASSIRTALRPGFPLDLLVRKPSDVKRRFEIGDPFLKNIFSKGTKLNGLYPPGVGR